MKNTLLAELTVQVDEKVTYAVERKGEGKPLFCLHGFSEDKSTWDQLELAGYEIYKIDLLGHGQSSQPVNKAYYRMVSVIEQLHIVIQQLCQTKYSLLGYSLGGRIALAYAIKYSDEIDCLALESTGIGIEHSIERLIRRNHDIDLAEQITQKGIGWFEQYWSNLPIFTSQKSLSESVVNKISTRRLGNSPNALANLLVGCSQGSQPYYGYDLHKLTMPVLYMAGELDKKYTEIGQYIVKNSPAVTYVELKNTGHNLHLERPVEFNCQLTYFFKTQSKQK